MTALTLTPCSITLDAFARITGLDPCGLMGIDPGNDYGCALFDCFHRRQFIYALESAHDLIANAIGGELCDTTKTLKSDRHYFSVPCDNLLETRRTEAVDMTVEVPEVLATPPCNTLVTLTGELVLAECEYIVNAEITAEDCTCPRLATEFCSASQDIVIDPDTGAQTITVTLVTHAYNLNDSTEIVDGTDLDWVPADVSVTFTIGLPEKEARVYWQPSVGCCPVQEETCTAKGCCHLQQCCACIRRSPTCVVDVIDWRSCTCGQTCCNPYPHHFEIDVVVPGLWKRGFEQAVVSLANNLMPQDWCSCNPMANLRYQRDTGMVENGQVKPDAMFYNNPFGIYTPGAKMAWSIVSGSVEKPLLVSL